MKQQWLGIELCIHFPVKYIIHTEVITSLSHTFIHIQYQYIWAVGKVVVGYPSEFLLAGRVSWFAVDTSAQVTLDTYQNDTHPSKEQTANTTDQQPICQNQLPRRETTKLFFTEAAPSDWKSSKGEQKEKEHLESDREAEKKNHELRKTGKSQPLICWMKDYWMFKCYVMSSWVISISRFTNFLLLFYLLETAMYARKYLLLKTFHLI